MAAGELVSDELVVAMVAERLSDSDAACGYVLDGFPRNVRPGGGAGRAAGEGAIDLVLLLEVPEDELVSRLLGRAADAWVAPTTTRRPSAAGSRSTSRRRRRW